MSSFNTFSRCNVWITSINDVPYTYNGLHARTQPAFHDTIRQNIDQCFNFTQMKSDPGTPNLSNLLRAGSTACPTEIYPGGMLQPHRYMEVSVHNTFVHRVYQCDNVHHLFERRRMDEWIDVNILYIYKHHA